MKQYLTVPAPQGIVGKGANEQQAVNTFAQIINQQASAGWTYHSMESIAVAQTGCLRGLIPNPNNTTVFYMLIFERDA